jgi:hypothetical protein
MEENRDEMIKVYVTEETKEDVHEKAAENGMSASTYSRIQILDNENGGQEA